MSVHSLITRGVRGLSKERSRCVSTPLVGRNRLCKEWFFIHTYIHSFLLYYVGINGVTFIVEHTMAQQLLSIKLAACSLINFQGRGLATSELM